jgi:hypothetical protein
MSGRSRRGKRILLRRLARDSAVLFGLIGMTGLALYALLLAVNTPMRFIP